MTPTSAQLPTTDALPFILAGNATFTLQSLKTGVRYTYRVRQAEEKPGVAPVWFVGLLSGPDNDSDYQYIGLVSTGQNSWGLPVFRTTKASKLPYTSKPVVALCWVLGRLSAKQAIDGVEVWHAGRCGRCGRTLTVPESVAQGIGPECIKHIGAAA